MILYGQCLLDDSEIIEYCANNKVAVYGAGNDGRLFNEKFGAFLDIVYYIDQDKKEFENKKVYCLEEIIQNEKKQDVIIVIASRRYQEVMAHNLEGHQLRGGLDFYIWDTDKSESNENIRCFIDIYKRCWKEYKTRNPENEIIIPYEGVHDGASVLYSYCANYLAKQNNAKICAYIRRDATPYVGQINRRIIDLYNSFNVEEVIEISFVEEREKKVQNIYEEVINTINTTEDWNHIWIEGVDYGSSINRDYLRFYPLSFEPLNDAYKECLRNAIRIILFWREYFEKHSVKYVFLWDGCHNESYLRDIAIIKGIPVYIMHCIECTKASIDNNKGKALPYLKELFSSLTETEKESGIAWARRTIEQIHAGSKEANIPGQSDGLDSVFGYKKEKLELGNKNVLKVLICPHVFNEDSNHFGGQIFGNYIAWLQFLGEMSEKTEYEWYIKLHPHFETERGHNFIKEYTEKYPKISLLPATLSPYSLRDAGIRYAFTVGGSIGHEYPLLGIDVINAGNNPHISFDFNINPKNKEEFEEVVKNLPNVSALDKKEEIYSFYCAYFIYYTYSSWQCLKNIFHLDDWFEHCPKGNTPVQCLKNTSRYLMLWSEDMHKNILNNLPMLFEDLEEKAKNKISRNTKEIVEKKLKEGVSRVI